MTGRGFLGLPPTGRVSNISPDRITRHASPARKSSDSDTPEVVSRIPQPYRTSFSAVTTPRRVTRESESDIKVATKKDSPDKSIDSLDTTDSSPVHKISPEVHISPPSSSQSSSRSSKKSEHSTATVISATAIKEDTVTALPVEKPKDYLKPERRSSSGAGRTAVSSSSSGSTSSSHKTESKHSSISSRRSSSPRASTSKEGADVKVSKRDKKKSSDSYIDYPEITEETVDSVFTDNAPHVSITSGEVEVQELMRSPSPHRYHRHHHDEPSSPVKSSGFHSTDTVLTIDSDVRKKEIIEKEYIIDYIVDYNNVKNIELKVKANKETDKLVRDMIGSRSSENTLAKRPLAKRDSSRSKASSAPSTPKASRKEQGRPQLQSLNGEDSPKVKKSLSASITNFFKRMSPKQLRRSPRASNNSSTSSLHDTDQESSVDGIEPRRRRSRTRSPKSPIRRLFPKVKAPAKYEEPSSSETKENLPSPTGPSPSGQSGHPRLTTSAARILKSIEDNTSQKQEKSVYKSFKDKYSPRHSPEAISLKQQALKVVEISQGAIESSPEVTISKYGSSEDKLVKGADTSKVCSLNCHKS